MREEIVKFVEKFKKTKGFVPTQAEIAKGLRTSRQRINYHFKDMREELGKYSEYVRFFV